MQNYETANKLWAKLRASKLTLNQRWIWQAKLEKKFNSWFCYECQSFRAKGGSPVCQPCRAARDEAKSKVSADEWYDCLV